MIGYHYTTWEAYQYIRAQGLQLLPLEERHRHGCQEVLHLVENGCIWVYPEYMQDRKLAGMIVYIACRHDSNRIVCLEVEYPEVWSAIWLASAEFEDDTHVVLRHTLDLSVVDKPAPFGHTGEPFDLIIEPVSAKDIRIVGKWDLLEFAKAGIIKTGVRMVA